MKKKNKYRLVLDNHVKRRAKERYDLDLTSHDLIIIIKKIQMNQTHVLKRYTNSRTVHKINHKGIEIPVLYSSSLKRIVTVLPENELNAESYFV